MQPSRGCCGCAGQPRKRDRAHRKGPPDSPAPRPQSVSGGSVLPHPSGFYIAQLAEPLVTLMRPPWLLSGVDVPRRCAPSLAHLFGVPPAIPANWRCRVRSECLLTPGRSETSLIAADGKSVPGGAPTFAIMDERAAWDREKGDAMEKRSPLRLRQVCRTGFDRRSLSAGHCRRMVECQSLPGSAARP